MEQKNEIKTTREKMIESAARQIGEAAENVFSQLHRKEIDANQAREKILNEVNAAITTITR